VTHAALIERARTAQRQLADERRAAVRSPPVPFVPKPHPPGWLDLESEIAAEFADLVPNGETLEEAYPSGSPVAAPRDAYRVYASTGTRGKGRRSATSAGRTRCSWPVAACDAARSGTPRASAFAPRTWSSNGATGGAGWSSCSWPVAACGAPSLGTPTASAFVPTTSSVIGATTARRDEVRRGGRSSTRRAGSSGQHARQRSAAASARSRQSPAACAVPRTRRRSRRTWPVGMRQRSPRAGA
jgi:hypothetical protein